MFHVKHITGTFRCLENGVNPRGAAIFGCLDVIVRASIGSALDTESAAFGVRGK